MNLLIILPYYFVWHYGRALSDISRIWRNFLAFAYDFFSIRTLFFTLFSPWRRMGDEYKKNASLEDIAGTFAVNMMMRLVGAIVRLIFIFIGIIFLALILCIGAVFSIVWLFLPIIFVYLIIYGVVGLLR